MEKAGIAGKIVGDSCSVRGNIVPPIIPNLSVVRMGQMEV
jgi:hypothetical protein